LSWVLAGLGLLGLATGLRPDRRAAAALGGLLLSASSWVRLADAGISAPEPYVLPLAALALVLGVLRRREEPATTSWAAYGPGLLLALVPSLLAGLEGDDLTRLLLVGLAAMAVLLAGARSRLQAPLAVGAGVLVVVALDLVGPYAVALPRWLSLGSAGTLLLVLGATYEQRRRDLARLRDGFDALA
jgi:cell division protein FtsW (lipid II flippase)